jgi:hypothetical protein
MHTDGNCERSLCRCHTLLQYHRRKVVLQMLYIHQLYNPPRREILHVPFDIIQGMISHVCSAMPYCCEEDKYNYSDYNWNSAGGLRSQHLELVEQWKQHGAGRRESKQ